MNPTVSPYPRCATAADFFTRQMREFARRNPGVQALTERLQESGVDILALVDHWTLPASPDLAADLRGWGFVEEVIEDDMSWSHPLARLPRVRLNTTVSDPKLALAVEDVALFLKRNHLTPMSVAGDVDSNYEVSTVRQPVGSLQIIARRGYRGFRPAHLDSEAKHKLEIVRHSFQLRSRSGSEAEIVREAGRLYAEAASLVGAGRAVDEFFFAETEFYMARNSAAQFQFARQQEHGIGWANHDHHTYRSTREGFQALMQLWQQMGFLFRERFYAGADAGWGAQVLEHPVSRVILFCDVDMSPAELEIDFLNVPLPSRDTYGTIGLWCALHGSSIAEAGMHHLECEFDFASCEAGFKAAGFGVMKPFTDLPMLKQAFTAAELWVVGSERLSALVGKSAITEAQAQTFARDGAAGSHLEILQRWDGFKGFNKTGVSAIIRETDARLAAGVA